MSELKPILEQALNELIFGNNYEAKLKVIQALAIIGANESVDKLRNTRPDLKAELVEAIEQAFMAGQADAGVDPSYSSAKVYAEPVVNTIMGDTE